MSRRWELDVPRGRLREREHSMSCRKLHEWRANERSELPRWRPDVPRSGDESVRAVRVRRDGVQNELHGGHRLLGGELV
jgi:hypothetical protein